MSQNAIIYSQIIKDAVATNDYLNLTNTDPGSNFFLDRSYSTISPLTSLLKSILKQLVEQERLRDVVGWDTWTNPLSLHNLEGVSLFLPNATSYPVGLISQSDSRVDGGLVVCDLPITDPSFVAQHVTQINAALLTAGIRAFRPRGGSA